MIYFVYNILIGVVCTKPVFVHDALLLHPFVCRGHVIGVCNFSSQLLQLISFNNKV